MSQTAARQPIPVGKYFLERGKITPQQLELALRHRQEFNLKLGQSLVELGLVTEAEMVEALRHQARFPCVHLTSGIVDVRIANKLGEAISRRLRAVALNQIAGHTTIALEDPSDGPALDELSHNLGTRIFPVYAEPSAVRKILDQVFGQRPPIVSKSKAAQAAPARSPDALGALHVPEPSREPKEPAAAAPGEPDERAVVEKVRAFLQEAFAQSVSDIHLEARRDELRVRFRVDGVLREHSRLPRNWARPTLACLKALAKLDGSELGVSARGAIPFTYKQEQLEVRIATTPSLHGESGVLHIVRSAVAHRKLADLGLTDEQRAQLEDVVSTRAGLVLVAGPGGSGRTTTLHALLERFVAADKKVIALEEKGEFEVEGVLHVELDPRIGGYAATARTLLRQDPDVLLLGEIDGKETAQVALEAARSGSTILAGVHASGALAALARLMHFGLEPYLFADALRAVVGQRLVRRICQDCKAAIVPDEVLRTRLDLPRDATYHEGEGCIVCQRTGYSGRIGLFEVLEVTPALRRELEKGADHEALARVAREGRFTSLREHGLRQARTGLTTLHEVLAAIARG